MKKQVRYEIEQNEETKMFIVLDHESQIKVYDENGSVSQGKFVAGFKTKSEAQAFVDRMMLRHVWGI